MYPAQPQWLNMHSFAENQGSGLRAAYEQLDICIELRQSNATAAFLLRIMMSTSPSSAIGCHCAKTDPTYSRRFLGSCSHLDKKLPICALLCLAIMTQGKTRM